MSPAIAWPSPEAPAPLVADSIHIWCAALDETAGPVAPLRACLSAAERARADRFLFDVHRHRFIVSHAAVRHILAVYLDRAPAAIEFQLGPQGKPRLDGERDLRFNLTHTHDLALLAVARGREIGVDVEKIVPLADMLPMAERCFSARETAQIRALDAAERDGAFYSCWTRKEAYIKATGDGLARALDGFEVSLGPVARLERVDGDADETARWWMEDLRPADGYAGAVVVEGEPAHIDRWKWPPTSCR